MSAEKSKTPKNPLEWFKHRIAKDQSRETISQIDTSGRRSDGSPMSRRNFLEMTLKAVGALTIASQLPGEPAPKTIQANVELEPTTDSVQTILVDFDPKSEDVSILETSVSDGSPTIKEILAKFPPSQPIGNDYSFINYFHDNYDSLVAEYGEKLYPTMLFAALLNDSQQRGSITADAVKKSATFYGEHQLPATYPALKLYQESVFTPSKREGKGWENYILNQTIKAETVIPFLETAKNNSNFTHTVFNLDLQLGSRDIIFDGEWNIDPVTSPTSWTTAEKLGPNNEPLFFVIPPGPGFDIQDGVEQTGEDGKSYLVFTGGNDVLEQNFRIRKIDDRPFFVQINGDPALEAKPRSEAEILFDLFEGKAEEEAINDPKVNPVTSIQFQDAYDLGRARENFAEIVKVALAFPNDFIVLSAGDVRDDWRDLPELPDNIIIVGEWRESNIKPTGLVYGAQIYVPNSKFGLKHGSNAAAALITDTIQGLIKQGVPFQEIKQQLQTEFSTQEPYRARKNGEPDSTLETAQVLSIDKLHQKMQFEF